MDGKTFTHSATYFITSLAEIEKVSNTPLQELLKDLGGWPVLEGDSWSGDNFNWLDTLIAFRKYGFSHDLFMDLSVTPDFRNNTRHVIDVCVSLKAIRFHGIN